MPLNERRRKSKIVKEQPPEKKGEVVGGLKNALERGSSLAAAKKSFINAGYSIAEVNAAARKIPKVTPQKQPIQDEKSQNQTENSEPIKKEAPEKESKIKTFFAKFKRKKKPKTKPPKQKKQRKIPIIIIIFIIVSMITIAAFLGLFWDRIF